MTLLKNTPIVINTDLNLKLIISSCSLFNYQSEPPYVKQLVKNFCIMSEITIPNLNNLNITESGYLDIFMKTSTYIKIRLCVININDQLYIIGVNYKKENRAPSIFTIINSTSTELTNVLLNDCELNLDDLSSNGVNLSIYI